MKISVFTPTYNRAPLLKRVYDSLIVQNNTSFEWVIVDDGSTDDTEVVVANFMAEKKIPIIYFKQENKGKHFAINQGVKLAKGDYFLILDSDDALAADAINQISENINLIVETPNVGGIVGRKIYFNDELIGQPIGNNIISNALDIRYKHNVNGDLAEVFKTKVLREFPFPEIENEKFCPEALVWNRIAQKYNLLFSDILIYQVEYLSDGLTAKIVKIRMTSPIASMICYSELASYKIPFVQKIKANLNFWRFSFNSNESFFNKMKRINSILSLFCLPLGYVMYIKDQRKWL
jgi:glycosyltransferase involved in cell wall biosynthesis